MVGTISWYRFLLRFLISALLYIPSSSFAQSITEVSPLVIKDKNQQQAHKGQGLVLNLDLLSYYPALNIGIRSKGKWEYGITGKVSVDDISNYLLIAPYTTYFLGFSQKKARPYIDLYGGFGMRFSKKMNYEANFDGPMIGGGMNLGLLFGKIEFCRVYMEIGFLSTRAVKKETLIDSFVTTIKTTKYDWIPMGTLGFQF